MKALFITLDGVDGTGKSTQCRLLAEWLRARGQSVVTCADPGGTAVGSVIRDLLLHQRHTMTAASEALLFMASRAQLVDEIIRPSLESGQVVVCDRFLLANVVYQGHAGGVDPELLWQAGKLSTGGLEPHLTLVLDMPVEAALSRRKGPADRVESRDVQYHTKVREGFLTEARRRPELIRVIDASQSVETVHARIVQEVSRVLAAGSRT